MDGGFGLLKRILACLFFFVASGCSGFLEKFSRNEKEGSTTVSFSSRSAASSLGGGAMVYAQRSDGFTKTSTISGASGSLELPNGDYRFRLIGFSDSDLGVMYCGVGSSALGSNQDSLFNLRGTPITVNVSLSSSNCNSSLFKPASVPLGGMPLEIVPCGPQADLSSLGGSDDCGDGNEGGRFAVGNPLGVTSNPSFNPATRRYLYTSDSLMNSMGAGRVALFSVKEDGSGRMLQVGSIQNTLRNIYRLRNHPTRPLAFFLYDDLQPNDPDFTGVTRLHKTVPGAFGSSVISLPYDQVPGEKFAVISFWLSPNGRYLLYAMGRCTSPLCAPPLLDRSLYKIDLEDPTLSSVRISPDLPNPAPSTLTGLIDGNFDLPPEIDLVKIDPTSSRVAYRGKFEDDLRNEIWVSNLNGPPNPIRVNQTVTPGQYHTVVAQMAWNHNGTKLLFGAFEHPDPNVVNSIRLYAVQDFSTAGQAFVIDIDATYNSIGGDGIGASRFYLSPTEDKVFFLRDSASFNSYLSAYISDFSGSVSLKRVFNNTTLPLTNYRPLAKWTPDGSKVVFISVHDPATGGDPAVFLHRLSDSEDTVTKISPATSPVFNPSFPQDYSHLQVSNSSAQFNVLVSSSPQQYVPHTVTLVSSGAQPVASPLYGDPLGAFDYDPVSFFLSPQRGRSYFQFSPSALYQFEVLSRSADLSDSGPSTLPKPFDMSSLVSILFPSLSFPGWNGAIDALLLKGGRTVNYMGINMAEEFWTLPNAQAPISSTNSYTLLTRTFSGIEGSGRIRIHLANYSSQGGTLSNVSPGISSPCYDQTSLLYDGAPIPTAQSWPLNEPGASLRFTTIVDVFNGAEDCSGTPERTIFPNGLMVDETKSKAVLNGAADAIQLFLKD